LCANRDRLVAFFNVPADHWKHLRTTNVIESPFAPMRLRERATIICRVARGFQLRAAPESGIV
jgi:transposase-like protein